MLERRLGPVPILGIRNCEIEAACRYAMADSDFELQVAWELKKRRADPRYLVDPGDYDLPMVHG